MADERGPMVALEPLGPAATSIDGAAGPPLERPAISPAGPRRRIPAGVTGLTGFAAYAVFVGIFFIAPCAVVFFTAFRRSDAAQGHHYSLQNWSDSLHGAYLTGLLNSVQLAGTTAIIAGAAGLVLAWAIAGTNSAILRRLVSTSSAVLANFGGLPLAFLFVAAIGSAGVLTKGIDKSTGINLQDDLGFSLFTLHGVELVYLYFLIPLMVLVITPALEGIKPQWSEAATGLGASERQYWRMVALPVLLPSVLGSILLLFCSALSAFATASALTNGSLAITPLQIDTAVSGNVLVGQDNLAAALALNMILIVVPLTIGYQFLQRKTSRWLR